MKLVKLRGIVSEPDSRYGAVGRMYPSEIYARYTADERGKTLSLAVGEDGVQITVPADMLAHLLQKNRA